MKLVKYKSLICGEGNKMSLLDWLFEKYRNEEMSSLEVNRKMSENQLLQEMSSADTIMDNLDYVQNDRNFQTLVASCKGLYLQQLSVLNATEDELSFSDYIDMCMRYKHVRNRFNKLSSEQKDKFWSLVTEIADHFYD